MSGMIYAVAGLMAVVIFFLGFTLHRSLVSRERRGALSEVDRILTEGRREAETIKKEALLEGREVIAGEKAAMLEKLRHSQSEMDRRESHLNRQAEQLQRNRESLDAKAESLSGLETVLAEREQALNAKHVRANKLIEEHNQKLEDISHLTREEARYLLLSNLREEARHEAAKITRGIIEEAEKAAEEKAAMILSTSIQRCAASHVVENCVSVVSLTSDELKGRIIGREGRNIRAFESATGVDVVIDDTPEAVVLSCFDPVRREVARQALEKLMSDGRIHPGRIESIVQKATADMEKRVRKLGNELALEANVPGLHSQLIRHLGRLRYRTSYGQNMYQHSLEVAHICGLLAGELKLDPALARRAGLLHDIGKATDQDLEGSHAVAGMELARRYDEQALICNAIGAHHEEVEPTSLYAVLVQAADAVSSARPGARRETLELYVRRLHKLEAIADSFEGVSKSYAIQAGRELRIAVKPEQIDDTGASDLAREIARKIESDMEYPGQIKVTVIREVRASETAK